MSQRNRDTKKLIRPGGRVSFLFAALATVLPLHSGWGAMPEPPPVVLRDVANAPRLARGTSVTLERTTVTIALSGQTPREAAAEVVLFLPEGWTDEISTSPKRIPGVPVDEVARMPGAVWLTVHFHGAPWFVIEEHARRGAKHPLLAFYLGEGSSMYGKPFQNPDYFPRMLEKAQRVAAEESGVRDLRFDDLEVQSVSAGYGSVRELLQDDRWRRAIRRLVLADSLYAGLTTRTAVLSRETTDGTTGVLVPEPGQMAPFVEYARSQVQEHAYYCQFLFAHSSIRIGSYADTVRTSDDLIQKLGGTRTPVTTGSLAAAAPGAPFPLESRYDRKGVHVWGYGGTTGGAHMAIARTIPEFWYALDAELPPDWKTGVPVNGQTRGTHDGLEVHSETGPHPMDEPRTYSR